MALGLHRAPEAAEDISRVISRVKRAMPRNMDVMAICEFVEAALRVRHQGDGIKRKSDPERVRELTRLRVKRHRERKKAGQK